MGKEIPEHGASDHDDPYAAENNGSWWALDTRISKVCTSRVISKPVLSCDIHHSLGRIVIQLNPKSCRTKHGAAGQSA